MLTLKKCFVPLAVLLPILSGCTAKRPHPCFASAHRGDRSSGADNSSTAIESAVAKNFPFIEVDVRRSHLGELILFHDKTLTKENFHGPVEYYGKKPEQLPLLAKSEVLVCNPSRCDPIISLASLLNKRTFNNSTLQLDVKDESQETIDLLVKTISANSMEKSVVVQCQYTSTLRYLRMAHPSIKALARVHDLSGLDEILSLSPYITQIDTETVTKDLVEKIHSHKSLVLVKTLDSKSDSIETWRKLRAAQVDIILTDAPADVEGYCKSG